MIELRRGDCGHLVPADMEPNAVIDDDTMHPAMPARVCPACLDAARAHKRPKVETKVVGPDDPIVKAYEAGAGEPVEPHALGAAAALAGGTEGDCPYPDRRTKDAKEWLRGFREARDRLGGGQ